jgi:hypothetical protein
MSLGRLKVFDSVKESSTTTGTVAMVLGGAETGGFQTFSAVYSDQDGCIYRIQNTTASEWETGVGHYNVTGNTLSRDTVTGSSNGGALVNFSAGTKDVFVTVNAGFLQFPTFNVKSFGAKGDGSTDDTAAIQAAINNAQLVSGQAINGVVLFPPGTYVISSTLVAGDNSLVKGVYFQGAGQGASVINWPANTGGTMLQINRMRAYSISDLTFNYGGATPPAGTGVWIQAGAGTGLQSRNGYFRNISFQNLNIGLRIGDNSPGNSGASDGLYENVLCQTCNIGVQIENAATLNHHFVNLTLTNNNQGLTVLAGVTGVAIHGGRSIGNAVSDFNFGNYGGNVVDSFYCGSPNRFVIATGSGSQCGVTVSNCHAEPSSQGDLALIQIANETTLVVYASRLKGGIQAGNTAGLNCSVTLIGSYLTGAAPISAYTGGGATLNNVTYSIVGSTNITTSGTVTGVLNDERGVFVAGTKYVVEAMNSTGAAGGMAWFGATPVARQTVSGAKGGNAALTSLMTALAALGLVTDSTT